MDDQAAILRWPQQPADRKAPPAQEAAEVERRVAELQRGIKAEENFRWIFSHYHRAIFHFFVKRGMTPDRGEDLTQEVFLRVYRSIGGFRGEASFTTWLFHIAWNLWRTEYRGSAQDRNARLVSLDETAGSEEPLPIEAKARREEDDPLGCALTEERRTLIHRELRRMPAQMRRCIVLRIDRGLKYREIAELMHISIDTVKSHLNQAKVRLKNRLGEP
jgi:RNA polymerase sigma-70 factor, ECF subfamily